MLNDLTQLKPGFVDDQNKRTHSLGSWCDASFTRDGLVVTDAPPPYHVRNSSPSWTYAEFTLTTLEDARELYSCLTSLVALLRQARKISIAAFSCFHPDWNTGDPTELDILAYKYDLRNNKDASGNSMKLHSMFQFRGTIG